MNRRLIAMVAGGVTIGCVGVAWGAALLGSAVAASSEVSPVGDLALHSPFSEPAPIAAPAAAPAKVATGATVVLTESTRTPPEEVAVPQRASATASILAQIDLGEAEPTLGAFDLSSDIENPLNVSSLSVRTGESRVTSRLAERLAALELD
ncbi:MAG: hypothetical protein AAF747_09880 [Planctomycetota bacterium]